MRKKLLHITVVILAQWLMICAVNAQENEVPIVEEEEEMTQPSDAPVPQPVLPVTRPQPSALPAPKPVEEPVVVLPDTVIAERYNSSAYGKEVEQFIERHPIYHLHDKVIFTPTQLIEHAHKDELFYVVCGMFLFLGVLKAGFPKYFGDLITAFTRFSFRQTQMREQLQQAGMTTLLYNIFFIATAALYLFLIVDPRTSLPSTLLMAVCLLSVGFVYVSKFFILKLAGWMFNSREATDIYIYIVFLINKVLAVLLLPCVLVISFADDWLREIMFTISLFIVAALLIYRFMLSYYNIRSVIKINPLHLVLYVIGFEIIPVLVIYKMLTDLLQRSL